MRLIGQKGEVKSQISRKSLTQKIDVAPHGEEGGPTGIEYDPWREISFLIDENYEKYFVEIELDFKNIDATKFQQIWADIFVGLKLKDAYRYEANGLSNVGSVNVEVR